MLTAISRGAGKGQCPQRRIHDARGSTAPLRLPRENILKKEPCSISAGNSLKRK